MKMIQASVVNWGHLPHQDVSFGGLTLLAGESGAGKTSFIDAIIAVATGNDPRYARYNAAQTEGAKSAKKSKRTFASYVLGADDSGPAHRAEGAHGYAAIAWEPDASDRDYGAPFTAIVGGEARSDKLGEHVHLKMVDEQRLIVIGHRIGSADLIEIVNGEEEVIRVQDLALALRKRFGRDAVLDFGTKSAFTSMLYARLKGSDKAVTNDEAIGCMRAFVNSVAYRQPDDLHGLIRDEILEAEDNKRMITELTGTIRDVSNLRIQADRLQNNVSLLEEAQRYLLEEASPSFMEEWTFVALAASRRFGDAKAKRDAAVTMRDEASTKLGEATARDEREETRLKETRELIRSLGAQIAASDVDRIRRDLEREIEKGGDVVDDFNRKLSNAGLTMGVLRALVTSSVNALRSIDGMEAVNARLGEIRTRIEAVDLPALKAHFLAVKNGLGATAVEELAEGVSRVDTAVGAGWSAAIEGDQSILNDIGMAADRLRAELRVNTEQRDDLERRRQSFAAGRANYPPEVSAFRDYLQEVLPESRPRILCDVVEMTDPAWARSVEGFIGADRYAILYDKHFETRVIALLRRYQSPVRKRPSVVQIGEALKEAANARPGSLVDKIRTSDPVAISYLKARYGRSMCVATEEDLRSQRSALLVDGTSVHAFQYRNRAVGDEDLVFGVEVRRRHAASIAARIETLRGEIERDRLVEKAVKDAETGLARARPADLAGLDSSALSDASAVIRRARIQLDELDLSSIQGLEDQLAEENERADEIEKLRIALAKQIANHEQVFDSQTVIIDEQDAEIAKLAPGVEKALKDMDAALVLAGSLKRPHYDRMFREEMESGREVKSFEDRRAERRLEVVRKYQLVQETLRVYNAEALDHQKVLQHKCEYPTVHPAPMAQWIEAIAQQVYDQLRRQRNTGLVELRAELKMAEINFTSAFTTNFCQRILGKVTGPMPTIEVVNKNLEHISFSGDQMRVTASPSPEFEEYISLFRAVQAKVEANTAQERSDDTGTLDLFNDVEFDPKDLETLAKLKALLLSNDVERSIAELERIADYRNYKKYDFAKRSKSGEWIDMSTWGTGSGGESETAFYIIRAAVFAAGFKLFSKQNCAHFRTMFLDEVFGKMDETRTRRVIDFLSQTIGLQLVISAPSKSTAAVLDIFDKRIGFAKSPEAGSQSWISEANLDRAKIEAIYDRHRRETEARAVEAFDRANPLDHSGSAIAAE